MPQPNPQSGSNNSDDALDFLWLIVMVVAAIVLTWYFGKDYITAVLFQVRYYEIIAIKSVLTGWNSIANIFYLPTADLSHLQYWQNAIANKTISTDFNTTRALSAQVGWYLRFPFAIILAVLAFYAYQRNISSKFKNVFTMKRLKSFEVQTWPQITPVSQIDIVKQDLDEGAWAMSMTPMQYCRKFNLIQEEINENQLNAKLLRGAAHAVFTQQLGALWTKPENCPIHVQALFAIFAAYANKDRDIAEHLLKQISISARSGKLNFSGVHELVAKYKNSKLVTRVTQRHAYVSTVMSSMLEVARSDGVIASADFLWLKPTDRRLWYVLNSVGRQTAVAEAAGVFGHWCVEKKLRRSLRTPMVEEAVIGLESALADIVYEVEED